MSLPTRPQLGYLYNLDTDESSGFFFNPTELSLKIAVNWAEIQVVGLSFVPRHYNSTSNRAITLTLRVPSMSGMPVTPDQADDQRRFLQSLCYPTEAGGSPPDVLFSWPNFASLVTKVDTLDISYTRFAQDGRPIDFSATIGISETREVRLLSGDVREAGERAV